MKNTLRPLYIKPKKIISDVQSGLASLTKRRFNFLTEKNFNEIICISVSQKLPVMIGKIGGNERTILDAVFRTRGGGLKNLKNIIYEDASERGRYRGGVFPNEFWQYCLVGGELNKALKEIDLLVTWRGFPERRVLKKNNIVPPALFEGMRYLDPTVSLEEGWKSWTHGLAGKRVLLVSPFKDSIEHFLSSDSPVLEYYGFDKMQNVAFVKPPQNWMPLIEGSRYNSWSEELADMTETIRKMDFDVCLVGAGAYSLPICRFVTRQLSKTSIHLGGGMGPLFGVIGGRWSESQPENYKLYKKYYREALKVPLDHEKPPQMLYEKIGVHDRYW